MVGLKTSFIIITDKIAGSCNVSEDSRLENAKEVV